MGSWTNVKSFESPHTYFFYTRPLCCVHFIRTYNTRQKALKCIVFFLMYIHTHIYAHSSLMLRVRFIYSYKLLHFFQCFSLVFRVNKISVVIFSQPPYASFYLASNRSESIAVTNEASLCHELVL